MLTLIFLLLLFVFVKLYFFMKSYIYTFVVPLSSLGVGYQSLHSFLNATLLYLSNKFQSTNGFEDLEHHPTTQIVFLIYP